MSSMSWFLIHSPQQFATESSWHFYLGCKSLLFFFFFCAWNVNFIPQKGKREKSHICVHGYKAFEQYSETLKLMWLTQPVTVRRCEGKQNKWTNFIRQTLSFPNNTTYYHLLHLTIVQHSCARPATFKMILTRCRGMTLHVFHLSLLTPLLLPLTASTPKPFLHYLHYSTQHWYWKCNRSNALL